MAATAAATTTKAVVYGTLSVVYVAFLVNLLIQILRKAMDIRMHAINDYGRIIHEFDPYFNFRATEVRVAIVVIIVIIVIIISLVERVTRSRIKTAGPSSQLQLCETDLIFCVSPHVLILTTFYVLSFYCIFTINTCYIVGIKYQYQYYTNAVFVGAWMEGVLSVVRLQSLVSSGTTSGHHHLSWHANYGRCREPIHSARLVPQ
jgi:hypothetical protein